MKSALTRAYPSPSQPESSLQRLYSVTKRVFRATWWGVPRAEATVLRDEATVPLGRGKFAATARRLCRKRGLRFSVAERAFRRAKLSFPAAETIDRGGEPITLNAEVTAT